MNIKVFGRIRQVGGFLLKLILHDIHCGSVSGDCFLFIHSFERCRFKKNDQRRNTESYEQKKSGGKEKDGNVGTSGISHEHENRHEDTVLVGNSHSVGKLGGLRVGLSMSYNKWNLMLKELSDSDLLTSFKAGDSTSKKEILLTLYERYKQLVLKVCFYHLADYDLANDVFHDVFVKVMENAETLKNPGVFKSWLMTITRNLCVDRLRRSSYLRTEESASSLLTVSCEDRVEDKYIAEMDRQKILSCLVGCVQNMDPGNLRIFKLRWKGMRAAQILKIVKTNKADLRRSYDRIKSQLESCMKGKGFVISIDQILSLGELDES